MKGVGSFLLKRWFLVGLVVLISLGIVVGMEGDESPFGKVIRQIEPRAITAFVLLLMAFSLDSRHLKTSFSAPGPVLWASAVNYGFIPLFGWSLVSLQSIPDFECGLMIACSVPCTLAAASVWTRKAKGNDAVSLLVTLATNSACFLMTPFWLNVTTGQSVEFDTWEMVWRLLLVVLIPTAAGQLLRQIPRLNRFAGQYKTPIGVVAQGAILVLVFSAACGAGARLAGDGPKPELSAVAIVWGSCIAIHLAAVVVALLGAKSFGYRRADRAAVAFAGSQKTLPIGILLATDPTMFGNPDLYNGLGLPFAIFPMLMYHASQLFLDTAIAERLAASKAEEE